MRINDLTRAVNGLVSPMEQLTFDPFNIESAYDWKSVMEVFKEEVSVSTSYCHPTPPLTSCIQITSRISTFSFKENLSLQSKQNNI